MSREWDSDCGDSANASKVLYPWDFRSPNLTLAVLSGISGATGNCLRLDSGLGTVSEYLRANLPTTLPHKIAGDRYQILGLPAFGYTPIVSFWDGAGLSNVSVYVDAAGRLSVWNGLLTAQTNQVGIFSAPGTVHTNTWVHIGFDLLWGTSAGSFVVYVDSLPVITASGAATALNNSGIGMVSIWGGTNASNGVTSGSAYHDDFYTNSTADDGTHTCMGFDGDIQAIADFAIGDGQYSQWSIGGSAPAGTRWQSINEVSPDDGATMITAATTSLKNTSKVGPLPMNVTSIICVSTILVGETDTAGLGVGAQFKPLIGNGTALGTSPASVPVSLNTNWALKSQHFGINPITSVAWVLPDFNSVTPLEVGAERTT